MSVTAQEAAQVWAEADCIFDEAAVEAAIDGWAERIADVLRGRNPVVLTVMNGALIPSARLLTRLDFPLECDYLHATRYRGATSGGELHWYAKPRTDLSGRVVLLVDDILDEGYTLVAILEWLQGQGSEAVYTAVLADKRHTRKADVQADFVALELPDRYVFGYGMDYKEYLRNAPGIFAVKGL